MIKLNKYLKEIGIDENYWLFRDQKEQPEDKRYFEDEEGFVPAEMWNLDGSLAIYIYSQLCYFKEHYNHGYPGGMTPEKWDKTLDAMITAFRLLIENGNLTDNINSKNREKKIKFGLKQFIKYFNHLWD